jgi:hypothetical protein
MSTAFSIEQTHEVERTRARPPDDASTLEPKWVCGRNQISKQLQNPQRHGKKQKCIFDCCLRFAFKMRSLFSLLYQFLQRIFHFFENQVASLAASGVLS